VLFFLICFFFSSRRRHTRFSRDWSSDVCSSDLTATAGKVFPREKVPFEWVPRRVFIIGGPGISLLFRLPLDSDIVDVPLEHGRPLRIVIGHQDPLDPFSGSHFADVSLFEVPLMRVKRL